MTQQPTTQQSTTQQPTTQQPVSGLLSEEFTKCVCFRLNLHWQVPPPKEEALGE